MPQSTPQARTSCSPRPSGFPDPARRAASPVLSFFFFFSSRRRHTRWNCDWSSDVCSSDLKQRARAGGFHAQAVAMGPATTTTAASDHLVLPPDKLIKFQRVRSCHGLPILYVESAESSHPATSQRSEEHTSELQSQFHLVCR